MTVAPHDAASPPAETEIRLDDSYRWCRSLTKRTAANFYYSFLTLPRDRRREMGVLYAFMRVSDDLGDADGLSADQRSRKLKQWRESLCRALRERRFEHPLLPALSDVVERRQIPHEYLFAVIEGIQMDLQPAGFETFEELADYCYHVAGVVGLCCIHIWGFRDEGARERAVDCGLAFQLTNILRDLGEDAAMGRCYLPREELRRFDYPEAALAEHRHDERFVRLMRFQVERARDFYRKAGGLYEFLDPAGRSILRAMLGIYGGLLDEIERRNYDVFTRRVGLSRRRKLMIAAAALLRERWPWKVGRRI